MPSSQITFKKRLDATEKSKVEDILETHARKKLLKPNVAYFNASASATRKIREELKSAGIKFTLIYISEMAGNYTDDNFLTDGDRKLLREIINPNFEYP